MRLNHHIFMSMKMFVICLFIFFGSVASTFAQEGNYNGRS